jgi:hypothetical protein
MRHYRVGRGLPRPEDGMMHHPHSGRSHPYVKERKAENDDEDVNENDCWNRDE